MSMKFQELMESYGMLKREQRLFYPRNFNLSPRFLAALKEELKMHSKSGLDARAFTAKLNKAIQFHITEYTKNSKPVEKEPESKKVA